MRDKKAAGRPVFYVDTGRGALLHRDRRRDADRHPARVLVGGGGEWQNPASSCSRKTTIRRASNGSRTAGTTQRSATRCLTRWDFDGWAEKLTLDTTDDQAKAIVVKSILHWQKCRLEADE
jgi:hypothetical protein